MQKFETRMRYKMEKEVATVNRWIRSLKHEPYMNEPEPIADNTPFSEEIEAMQQSEEKEIRFELLGRLIERSVNIDQALERIPQGTYGICARCERRIHRERLEALPEATHCLECQQRQERSTPAASPTPLEWLAVASFFKARSGYK